MFRAALAQVFATAAGNEVEPHKPMVHRVRPEVRVSRNIQGTRRCIRKSFGSQRIEPDMNTRAAYSEAYAHWLSILQNQIAQSKEGSVFSIKTLDQFPEVSKFF